MPTCFFILSRFTLRVDNVLFRQFDTRIFHSFSKSPPTIIRETSGWEAPYERVQRVRLYLIIPIRFLIAYPATPATRRSPPSHRPWVHRQSARGDANANKPERRRKNGMASAGYETRDYPAGAKLSIDASIGRRKR